MHRPVGTRVVFDDEGNTLPPLAKLADTRSDANSKLDKDKCTFFTCFECLFVCPHQYTDVDTVQFDGYSLSTD